MTVDVCLSGCNQLGYAQGGLTKGNSEYLISDSIRLRLKVIPNTDWSFFSIFQLVTVELAAHSTSALIFLYRNVPPPVLETLRPLAEVLLVSRSTTLPLPLLLLLVSRLLTLRDGLVSEEFQRPIELE